jgi:hypothetical protein
MIRIDTNRKDLVEQLSLLGRMYNKLHAQDALSTTEQAYLDAFIHWQREILDGLEQAGQVLVTSRYQDG